MNQLWFEKYRPRKIKELLIQKKDLKTVQKWISDFSNKVKGTPNCLFLHGPPGKLANDTDLIKRIQAFTSGSN